MIRRRTNIVTAEVGLELSCKDFEGRTLSNTIRTDKAKDLAGSWCR